MPIFEQFVGRGFTVLDMVRKVLVFNREVVGSFPRSVRPRWRGQVVAGRVVGDE
jgi:hypothetical protein